MNWSNLTIINLGNPKEKYPCLYGSKVTVPELAHESKDGMCDAYICWATADRERRRKEYFGRK